MMATGPYSAFPWLQNIDVKPLIFLKSRHLLVLDLVFVSCASAADVVVLVGSCAAVVGDGCLGNAAASVVGGGSPVNVVVFRCCWIQASAVFSFLPHAL